MPAAPYAAAAEARSCASWPRKSMNLPSSAAVAAFALQGATPLSSSNLLLVQSLSDSRRARSRMCGSTDAGHLLDDAGRERTADQAHSVSIVRRSLEPNLNMPPSRRESALDDFDGANPS